MTKPDPPLACARDLVDGASARVEGTVRACSAPLVSPLGGRECVYWDVRQGLDGAAERREAQDFWLEDDTGRVLVVGAELHVEARAERRQELVHVAEGELAHVQARLRELKDAFRVTQGPAVRPMVQERKRLAKVATLLCAVRAHARGRVHVGKTLAGQERWIAENAKLAGDDPGARTIERMVERWEVVLAPGERVIVRGRCRSAPLPPGIEGGGYRDRAMTMALVSDGEEKLLAEGVGAAAREMTDTSSGSAEAERDGERRPAARWAPSDRAITVATGIAVSVGVVITWLLTR